jgi:predicted transcriptional regulator
VKREARVLPRVAGQEIHIRIGHAAYAHVGQPERGAVCRSVAADSSAGGASPAARIANNLRGRSRSQVVFTRHPACITMSYMKDSAVTIRLPRELRRQLQSLSKAQSRPVSDLVRESIQRYVSIQKYHALRRSVLPFAEAEGLLIDEDVFSRIS